MQKTSNNQRNVPQKAKGWSRRRHNQGLKALYKAVMISMADVINTYNLIMEMKNVGGTPCNHSRDHTVEKD